MAKSLPERFWEKVHEQGESDCWPWTAATFNSGYGAFRVGKKQMKASRVAWFLTHGKWPELLICHRCDNPICCNPKHLFEGTSKQNSEDRNAKGRVSARERSPHCKLGQKQRDAIRAEYVPGSSTHGITGLAKRHKVGTSTIHRILNGKWR